MKAATSLASRGRLLGGLVLLALVAFGCGDDDSPGGGASATLRIHAGTVEVQEGSGAAFQAGSDGQVLGEGAVVRTASDGRASLEWFDGSVTRLDYDTVFRITELRDAGPLGGTAIEAEQDAGGSYHRVIELTETGSRFAVVTPTASAAVQGTTYAVISNPDGSSSVIVTDGQVEVTTESGEVVVVAAGEMVTVDPAGNVSGPVPIPPELLESDWIRFNETCDQGECVVDVTPGGLAAIAIAPADATINVGESQSYTATGLDASGASLGQVPATYDIDGVPCDGSTCTPPGPGDYTVTGAFGLFTATANLTVLATGDIQVTLDWTAPVDLDLWVTDPAGETVSWDNPFVSSGGRLDRDAYPDCDLSDVPPENTVWDETAPAGEYLVTVHVYDMCGATSVGFVLTVSIGGQVVLVVDDVVLTSNDETYEASFTKS